MKKKLILLLITVLIIGIVVWYFIPVPLLENTDRTWVPFIDFHYGETREEEITLTNEHITPELSDKIIIVLKDQTYDRYGWLGRGFPPMSGNICLHISSYPETIFVIINPNNPEANFVQIGRMYHHLHNAEAIFEEVTAILPDIETIAQIGE